MHPKRMDPQPTKCTDHAVSSRPACMHQKKMDPQPTKCVIRPLLQQHSHCQPHHSWGKQQQPSQWKLLPPRATVNTAHCTRSMGSPSDNKKLPLNPQYTSFSRRRAGHSDHQLILAHSAPQTCLKHQEHRPTVNKHNLHHTAFQHCTHKRISSTGHHHSKCCRTTNTHGRPHTASCSSKCHKSGRFTYDAHTHPTRRNNYTPSQE